MGVVWPLIIDQRLVHLTPHMFPCLHINGYEGWNGKHNSNVAIKIHYADDTFTEGEKTTDQAVVDDKPAP